MKEAEGHIAKLGNMATWSLVQMNITTEENKLNRSIEDKERLSL